MAAGLVPFAALAGLYVLGGGQTTWGLRVLSALIAYGAIILSFMAGTNWGPLATGDRPDGPPSGAPALIVTNALALLAWTALLHPRGAGFALPALALGFALHLAFERRRFWANYPEWYRRMRVLITAGVVICLAAASLRYFLGAG